MPITNRHEYIDELRYRLKRLPPEEIDNAVTYYEEYFDEAGEENEIHTILTLGTPAAVASKIIGEFAVNEAERPVEKNNRRSNALWVTILAVCASPIALPIGISAIAITIAFFVVIFALFIAGAAISVAGAACFAVGLWAFARDMANGMLYTGAGLILAAVGSTLFISLSKFGVAVFSALQRGLGKILIKRGG